METEESGLEHNSSMMYSQIDNSVEMTPSKLTSTEDMETLPVEPKVENKKRNKSFQKKNREQMRNRIKILSSEQNICDNSSNLAAPLPPKISQSVTEVTSSSKKLVFLRLQSLEDQDQIEKEREQGIYKISGNFGDFYELKETLGEGCVGLVKKAVRISDGQVFAVKTVRTRDEETIQNIKQEFLHLKQLNHPNIVKVYELYVDNLSGKIHSVMELIQGKEMFEVIHELGHYSELVASRIFSQILDAIAYMHQNYCCHRDLKPNNILCNNDGTEVKITDFNVSKFSDHYKNYQGGESIIHQSIKMWTYTGTMAFSAPEVFNGDSYDETIDMWSAGCILFTMLSGREPFQAEYVNDLVQQICQGKYNFDDPVWKDISQEAKDLISKCLTVDSTQRIKPEDALKHPFITRARVSGSFSSTTIECASPAKIPCIDLQCQQQQSQQSEYNNDEEKNEGVGTPVNANLCRKQLSNNIDRLIVSKKNKNLSHFRNERPRAVSSICILLDNKNDYMSSFRNNNLKSNNNNILDQMDDNQEDEIEEQEEQNEENTTECSHRKRKKKFTIIFSKEDCFSNHVDTDSSSNNLTISRKENNKSKWQVKQNINKLQVGEGEEEEFDLPRERSINSKKKRESNLSSALNLCEDSSQQQLDNQNMTTSSSSSSSLSSSLSPKNHKLNVYLNNINNSKGRNSKSRENLYWNDEESENYTVTDFIEQPNEKDSKSNNNNNNKKHSISKAVIQQQQQQQQQNENTSLFKTVLNSFKKRLVFSSQRNNANLRSYSCDIQNNEEFQQMQENTENLMKEISFLKNKDSSSKNSNQLPNGSTFQSSLEALTRLCKPAINRFMNSTNLASNASDNSTSNANSNQIEINVKQ